MKLYTVKRDCAKEHRVVLDDMILTADMPTTGGSKMLDGYMSLFNAEVVDRVIKAGYAIAGKANVGEFAIDLVGETSYHGECASDGRLTNAVAEIISRGDAETAICLDVNGYVRRAAAQSRLVSVKPTYGTVSRYGVIPVACSGETVSVIGSSVDEVREMLSVIAGHDDKDGTSLSDEQCARARESAKVATRVAIIKQLAVGVDSEVAEIVDNAKSALEAGGVEVCEIDMPEIDAARVAWNILMSAELCNNVSRYDGVKYGYRSQNYTNIDELYTNSRTEAFGELLKTAIIYGSDALSTDNYVGVYDKALRIRRVIADRFSSIFGEYDAVLAPVCSKMWYTENDMDRDRYIAFAENVYTAPASITGLPTVVVAGVQLIGDKLSEGMLLETARLVDKKENR